MKKGVWNLLGWKRNNRGMGTVEIILIIVVLIGLVLIFKNQIQQLAETIFEKIAADSSAILA
ncbi:MAG: Flp1 family type IVb pilin [Bacillota bacterium]|nr:Flp1 family type IVb pilin [Bacillota bacterium]